jgi:hypothetical protein
MMAHATTDTTRAAAPAAEEETKRAPVRNASSRTISHARRTKAADGKWLKLAKAVRPPPFAVFSPDE